MEKILSLIIKKSFLITFLISILLLSILGFFYWEYLYTPLEFIPEATIESKIEEGTLNKIIESISERERRYLKSLKVEYKSPF